MCREDTRDKSNNGDKAMAKKTKKGRFASVHNENRVEGPLQGSGGASGTKSRNSSRMDNTRGCKSTKKVAWTHGYGHMDAPSLRRAGQVSPQRHKTTQKTQKETERQTQAR